MQEGPIEPMLILAGSLLVDGAIGSVPDQAYRGATRQILSRNWEFRMQLNMEMHEIRYFLALCETLNFTRAAERCNISQPALTRAIKNLEDKIDAGPLVYRAGSVPP